LPDRQREIVESRFGLGGGRPRTLEEVGVANHTLNRLAAAPEAQALRNAPSLWVPAGPATLPADQLVDGRRRSGESR
jgi:hypothetical protein